MLKVEYTTQFKRDLKLTNKRKKNMLALQKIMKLIESEEILSPRLRDHSLSGNWKSHRELHIESDWLLIYNDSDNDSDFFNCDIIKMYEVELY